MLRPNTSILSLFAMAVIFTSAATTVFAQEGTQVAEAAESTALLPFSPVKDVFDAIGYNDLREKSKEKLGLTWDLGYTLVAQAASDVNDQSNMLTTGSFDFVVGYEKSLEDLGVFSASLNTEGGQILSHNDDENLSANIPSSLGVNDDWDNTNFAISQLWVRHNYHDKVIVTVGKIDIKNYFDNNVVANNRTRQFISSPLVHNPAIGYPGNGLGTNVQLSLIDHLDINFGASDSRAATDEGGFNTLSTDQVFVAGQVTYKGEILGLPGHYRAMVWHTSNGGGNDGAGVALNFDQQITEDGLYLFGRYGSGDEDVTRYEQFASLGMGVKGAFGRADDMLAFAYAGGREAAASRSEHLIEMFYRLKLIETIEVSPGLQFLFDHAHQGVVTVAGIRVQINQ